MEIAHPDGYLLGAPLGEGSFGLVYEAVRMSDGAVFAAKTIANVDGELTHEVSALKKLRHDGIVRFIESKFDRRNNSLFIITELCHGGSLEGKLWRTPERRLPADEAVVLAKVVLRAIRYLHLEGVVHCDIKVRMLALRFASCCAHRIAAQTCSAS